MITLLLAAITPYLMDRNAEIAMARSAAPDSLSRDASVLVLGPKGYETAAKGTNGWVCMVDRSWMLPSDDPEYLKPEVRLPTCFNAPAARFHVPLAVKRTALVMADAPKQALFDQVKAAYSRNELPLPEPGSMCYMMSKQQFFGPKAGHADPHLMWFLPQSAHLSWGAEFGGSPVDVHEDSPEPITTFIVSVSRWADGTAYPER